MATNLAERIANKEIASPPIAQLIGFDITELEHGRCLITFDAEPRHANPMGGLHGGVICDVTDAAMGMAYASTLDTAAGEYFTTVELKVNFLRPFRTGRLYAEGQVTNAGKTLGLVEAELKDESGRLIAKAASTCMTLRKENGAHA